MEESGNPEEKPDGVCAFFRKPRLSGKGGRGTRKRGFSEEEEEVEPRRSIAAAKRGPSDSGGLQFRTRPKEAREEVFRFESSAEIQVEHDSRATATLETETEFSRDARAIREKVLGQPGGDAALYRGIHGYTDYKAGFRREQTVSGEKAGGAHGPLRASAHIRVSARFDYQPDICKDYKETGYCGYGDACKFMHDRGDYKAGWQMEQDWEEEEKERKRKLAAGGEEAGDIDDDDDPPLPFACFICRNPFVDPVVTRCRHYFCEHCALKHHSRNKKCHVCNQPTNGIFNTAHDIRKRMAAAAASAENP